MRSSSREVDRLDAAKELAKSQLGFFRHAIFGKKDEPKEVSLAAGCASAATELAEHGAPGTPMLGHVEIHDGGAAAQRMVNRARASPARPMSTAAMVAPAAARTPCTMRTASPDVRDRSRFRVRLRDAPTRADTHASTA